MKKGIRAVLGQSDSYFEKGGERIHFAMRRNSFYASAGFFAVAERTDALATGGGSSSSGPPTVAQGTTEGGELARGKQGDRTVSEVHWRAECLVGEQRRAEQTEAVGGTNLWG